jgi:hypothetical protein
MTQNLKVSVFGGASPKADSAAYQTAFELGKLLGENGVTVLTGGYMGTMEAVSKGANEAGSHVIGVTCEEIEAWRPIKANPWVIEEWPNKTLRQRLFKLIDNCQAAIALPGGIGTLAEISLTWNQIAIHATDPKPLILLGDGWHKVLETFFRELGPYVTINSREFLGFAPDPGGAIEILDSLGMLQ